MTLNLIMLAGGLLAILTGAKLFTNGVEWLGKRLNLSEGAVGSILAAVGTALPETMVPLIAILFAPTRNAHEVGIGAILGAPFMLSTLAFGVVGVSKVVYCRGEECIDVKRSILLRDLKFFLVFYSLAVMAAFIPLHALKVLVALLLVAGYGYYVKKTLGDGDTLAEMDLPPLFLWKRDSQAPVPAILAQVFLGLGLIAGGADYFVSALDALATGAMVPALVLSLLITPVATELPEKFNSVIWVKGGKDTLAVGNITGAMVFQSTVIPAIGILFTPWLLTFWAALSAGLALLSSFLIYLFVMRQKRLKTSVMIYPVAIYGLFLLMVITML
ncbi:Ca2+/Na+ antiporter [Pelotomaculum thermopropionicum SI]|uniref:Ca2+/Na+ antiporter n=1 Tax=Pelotomaculum thermopropionicum (strain DSM 13744 / JCM 10971 / SI) TaxID=370438 RepID=A5D0V2_PELTS|nr:Ca2+/Na+ antiporter [Pelotomaculum thermopropionicum SI]